MRLLGLVVSAVCLGPALADGLDDLVKEFPQPKHRSLRAAGEVHASKKVYPPAPDASLPKSFDVWRPYFRELYEKQRDGVMTNEEVWRDVITRELPVLPDILSANEEIRAGLRGVAQTPDHEERLSFIVANDIKPLWPPKIFTDEELSR